MDFIPEAGGSGRAHGFRLVLERLAARRISIALIVSITLATLVTLVLLAFAVLSYNAESDARWRELHRELDSSADQLATAVTLPAWNVDEREILSIMRASLNNRDLYGNMLTLHGRGQYVFLRSASGKAERAAAPPLLPALRIAQRPLLMAGNEIGVVHMYVTPEHVLATLRERRITLIGAIVALDLTLVSGLYLLLWYLILKPLKAVGQYAATVKAGAGAAPPQAWFFGELAALNESIHDMVALLDLRYRAMQVSEERLTIATNAANIGIWDWDVVSNKLEWDDEMHRQFRVDKDAFGGVYGAWAKTVLPDDLAEVHELIQASLRGEREYNTQFRIAWPDGQIRHIKAASTIFRDATGRALRMVGVNYDITDLKQAENELLRHRHHLEELVAERTAALSVAVKQAEAANRAKSVFLATMSHELRTPLHSVIGFSRLLGDSHTMTDEEKHNLGVIHRSGQHLLTLINDLLELSKIEAGRLTLQPNVVAVEGVLCEVMEMASARARQVGLSLTLDSAGMPATVRIDGARLRQVLLNLVSNGVKFAEQGGVTLQARAIPLGGGRHALAFAVRDTGIGIAPEDQERIFEPFVQTESGGSKEGTGLGLAISREFVRMMGGTLQVESELGNGAVFRFTVEAEAADDSLCSSAGEIPVQGACQPDRRSLAASRLAQLPYELLVGLRDALRVLDPRGAMQLLEPYRREHAGTVRAVEAMLAQHQYPQLCSMINTVCAQQTA